MATGGRADLQAVGLGDQLWSDRRFSGGQTDTYSSVSHHFLNGLDMSIWEMKVTSIQEYVDMSTLTLDSLYTKLKTHEMNILARKVDFKSSALVSSLTSLDGGAFSSKSSILALFNAMSDEQLEQFEEEDLVLLTNKLSRAINNVRYRKKSGPNRCFECGALDHLRSHCPKLGKGKKEDNGDKKTKENKPKNTFKGKKIKETLKKAFDQVYAAFEPLSDVDGESEDEDKGKNIFGVCFMARGELDSECEDNEALVAMKENVWIVDSGCSRHMTGDKNWFSLKQASKTELIIFGDASTSIVLATGLVKVNDKFELKNVALVEDLKYNLLLVSQIVDENFEVHFKKTRSKVFDSCGDYVLNISRYGGVFKPDFENPVSPAITCLVAKFDKDVMFWHRRLGHVGFDHLMRLSGLDLVRGLPKLKKDLDLVCTPCHHAKMVASSHAPIVSMMTDAPGQLLHMNTVSPARVQSVRGKWYVLVIGDNFSRYSWVFFMADKDEAFQHFRCLYLRLNLEFPGSLKRNRSDNGITPHTLMAIVYLFWKLTKLLKLAKLLLRRLVQVLDQKLQEEVYVKQPPGFENPDFPNHVFKLYKALYGLKQAPRAWYDRLKNFLLAKGFTMGKIDKTLFVLKHGDNQLFIQIYVDDIIFGCLTHALVVEFAETMRMEFEMSMMGELSYFLGLQIKQTPQGTFVHQTKYMKDLLRRFKMENCKPISTPIGSTELIGKVLVEHVIFLILWLISTLKEYGLTFEKVPLFCDNTSAINIAKNPVQYSRTKHIDIRFHFSRDHVEKGDVELTFLDTKLQLVDIFTKPLDSNRFAFIRGELGIIHPFGMV
uniref:Retrotransposon protein, putative, unclassified n=1 Tax=Oryza sativa subsp. japonica TaxID=39947 RepID=Q2QSW1_ORYSJ|nr:retrotransposon protein, putative, unclassified [Oryza sativa Japonica Group]